MEVIRESDGILVCSQDCLPGYWREKFRAYFSWPAAKMGFSLRPKSEPIQVDTSPPSETEISRTIGFFETYKAAG